MTALKAWRTATALAACAVGAGLAYAKLPPLTDEQKAKADEAKAKAAEATKQARDAEEKSMDRVVERYKKDKGIKAVAATPAVQKK
jgi:hypothetical protein